MINALIYMDRRHSVRRKRRTDVRAVYCCTFIEVYVVVKFKQTRQLEQLSFQSLHSLNTLYPDDDIANELCLQYINLSCVLIAATCCISVTILTL